MYKVGISQSFYFSAETEKKDAFRESYSRLGELRSFVSAPFLCLTATPTSETILKISTSLSLNAPTMVKVKKDKTNI